MSYGVGVTSPTHFGRATIVAGYAVARSPKRVAGRALSSGSEVNQSNASSDIT